METRSVAQQISPNFDIYTKLIIDDQLVEFSFFGREDQVKMLSRELFYHYTGNFLFGDVFCYNGEGLSGNADCKPINAIMNQRFVEYTVSVNLNNIKDIARILWCIGKTTGSFFSPAKIIENARDHVRKFPVMGLREAVIKLETSANLAISRKDIPFEFKYDNFKTLQAHDITKSFWTDAEVAQEKLEQQKKEEEMLAVSYKGWSLRLFHTEHRDKGKQYVKYCPPSCALL